jgi:hypothetical protein
MRCRHCDDPLPDDAPPAVTSCRSYANWKARQRGDMLQADDALTFRDGLPQLPDLD